MIAGWFSIVWLIFEDSFRVVQVFLRAGILYPELPSCATVEDLASSRPLYKELSHLIFLVVLVDLHDKILEAIIYGVKSTDLEAHFIKQEPTGCLSLKRETYMEIQNWHQS